MADIIVIGGGPAGMQAALTAADRGLSVLLLDEQPAPGGQIYRNIEQAGEGDLRILGRDYGKGRPLADAFRARTGSTAGPGSIRYVANAMIWQLTDEREVGYTVGGAAFLTSAPWIVIATGAQERPFPVKGWTLPGVMMAGAAQTLLKSSGTVADGAVFAGCGPLLTLIVYQYLTAGVPVAAVLDTTAERPLRRVGPHIAPALRRADMLWKGFRWSAAIRRSGIPVIAGVSDLRVLGNKDTEAIEYRVSDGPWQQIETRHVFLHHGVVPNINLSMAAGLAHDWDDAQLCWRPRLDSWFQSSVAGISIAGDGGGISGAVAARASGALAALGAACRMGRINETDRDRSARSFRTEHERELTIRPFLDALFRPGDGFRLPDNGDIVACRCEEVTVAKLRRAIADGAGGPNQLKAFCRAGMGPCQGRFCGLTVQSVIAGETEKPPADVGYYRLRPPIKPVTVGELAAMAQQPEPVSGGDVTKDADSTA